MNPEVRRLLSFMYARPREADDCEAALRHCRASLVEIELMARHGITRGDGRGALRRIAAYAGNVTRTSGYRLPCDVLLPTHGRGTFLLEAGESLHVLAGALAAREAQHLRFGAFHRNEPELSGGRVS